jgi:membrane-associated phospholipid phosphatase
MRLYAEYIIFGVDVVTGIVIAITAAMTIFGFFRLITRTKGLHLHTIDKDNQA